MVFFLQSDVARLVLGYLKENKYPETYSCFLKECSHLSECYELLKAGAEFDTTVFGFSLLLILEEWGRCRQQGHIQCPTESKKTHTHHRTSQISHSNRNQLKNSSRYDKMSPPTLRKRVPTSGLFEYVDDTADSALDSDEIDGASNIHSLGLDAHHGGTSSEDENVVSGQTRHHRSRSQNSRSPVPLDSHKQILAGIQKHKSPTRRTKSVSPRKHLNVQFSDSSKSCGLTLLQTDNPGKSRLGTGEKEKYPNLANLLQVCAASINKNRNVAVPTFSQTVSQATESNIELTRAESVNQTGSVQTDKDSSVKDIRHVTVDSLTPVIATGGKSQNTGNSQTKGSDNTGTVIPVHKTPNKTSRSPQKSANTLFTPNKLFQDADLNNSTRSPRRKKPKTPRKRNSDVSPNNSQKEASGGEDRLPLFQQVLSDKRLHEKLAETCNIVSDQLKLSLSGRSENGDKSKAISPPNVKTSDQKQAHVTESKSLEEVLDIDTNYATEFLNEKIDMSDPAFECLFKLFGTDKESFSENLRKENQQDEKETEKLTKDLEDLERSLHEEFGTRPVETVRLPVIQKDKIVTGSQELYQASVHGTENQPSSQPASPFITQTECHIPFLGDGVADCMAGDRVNNFTPLLRGNEHGGSIYSTSSQQSTYNSGQYIGSPASVATQPFSPYHALSPVSYPSPTTPGAMEIPGTPVTVAPPGTPDSKTDHPNSPYTADQLQHVREDQLQQTPSHRSFSNDINSQSTPRQSSQSLLPNCSQSLPPNCSPLVKADLLAGSPIIAQKSGPLTPQNGPFTPQARKRILNPINTSQLFLSPQMYPLTGNGNNGVIQENANESLNSIPQSMDQAIYDGDVTLTDTNCENHVTMSTGESNSLALSTIITGNVNDHLNFQQYYSNSTLIDNVYHGDEVNFDKGECSTIVNTIGCISLPEPTQTELHVAVHVNSDQNVTKKKRSTRSDKGKKRKKLVEDHTKNGPGDAQDGLPVLKSLLTTHTQPGLTLEQQESTSLTAQDFDNQELVMLSPGGSSTLKFAVLKCVDAPSSPAISSINSVSENSTEGCDDMSVMLENQATSALMKSIALGDSTEIIKQAKTIADVNANDKKKLPVKKKSRKNKEKSDKSTTRTIAPAVEEEPREESDEILTASPVEILKKVHVRMLDFENQFKKIRPKPVLPDSITSAVIILNPMGQTTSNTNLHREAVSTVSSSNYSTSLLKVKNIKSVSMSTNDVCMTTGINVNLANNKPLSLDSTHKDDKKDTSECTKPIKVTASLCTNRKQNSQDDNTNLKNKTFEPKSVESEECKDRRCTRSSKPATMERLNDKGLAEKVINDAENIPSMTSAFTGSKLYRRKPKSGKDMRVIMKHLRTMEDEDDVFSDFTENSMDSIASMKSPMSVTSIKSPSSVVNIKSPLRVAGIKSPTSHAEIVNQMSECETVKPAEATRKVSVTSRRSEGYIQKDCVGLSKGNKTNITATKNTSPVKSPDKTRKKVTTTRQRGNSKNQKITKKSPLKKPVVILERAVLSTEVTQQTDSSSDDDVPLSKLKEKIIENNALGVTNTDIVKDIIEDTTSKLGKGKTIKEKRVCNKAHNEKGKLSEKASKENKETIARTPTKSSASPRRTSPSDVLTPSKEVWMEKVGLTPTKAINNSPHYLSPGRMNPLDVLAACQNSPLSDRKRCYTPNTRNQFRSPFKSPSGIRRRTPVKKLFDTTLPDRGPDEGVTCTQTAQTEVDKMIKNLQDNNPDSNLVRKVSSSTVSTCEDGRVVDETEYSKMETKSHTAKDVEKKTVKSKNASKKSKKPKKTEKNDEALPGEKGVPEKKKTTSKQSGDKKVLKHAVDDIISETQTHDLEKSNPRVNDNLDRLTTPADTDLQHIEEASDHEHLDECTDQHDESVQETCEATEFLMKELETGQMFEEENDAERIITNVELEKNGTEINSVFEEDTVNSQNEQYNTKDKFSAKDRTISEIENVNVASKTSVNEKGDSRNPSEKEDNCNINVGENRTNFCERIPCTDSVTNNGEVEDTGVTGDNNVRTNNVEEREVLADQREITLTPTVEIQTPVEQASGSSHHRHSGCKKKKKKSKKRHRDESLEAGDEERHKKRRKKHHKPHKHRKKHRKSAELSDLNVDAVLSQLYMTNANPTENPPLASNEGERHTSPISRTTSEPQDHHPSTQSTWHVNNSLAKVSHQDHPLQHSTPIVNNNQVKKGAFGSLFSPVAENMMTE